MNFKDRVVVITGSSQGFGKELAKAFNDHGAKVIVSSENAEKLKETAEELDLDMCVADVTKIDDIKNLADYSIQKHGRIDVWINNAGIQIAPSKIEEVDIVKLHNLFAINFFGYFYGLKVIIPIMRKQNEGIIININSTAGLDGKPGISAYVASKFAVKGLTQSARQELKDTNIQVFGIHPGGMQTEIYKEAYPADFDEYMNVEYAIKKTMENLESSEPELDLVIPRPAK
ncbi:MAG: SDR family oxidoreductase [Candidatus Saccharibacteria bacterium]|nr:SDR family oxidoreductase [Candidatus Saccharibacteria bacterium]